MYKDGYVYTISGYQLPSLPFVLIKERGNGDDSDGSGVHFIGLDGYKYLKDTNTSDATTGLNNNGDA
jgi:hypothetical protein